MAKEQLYVKQYLFICHFSYFSSTYRTRRRTTRHRLSQGQEDPCQCMSSDTIADISRIRSSRRHHHRTHRR